MVKHEGNFGKFERFSRGTPLNGTVRRVNKQYSPFTPIAQERWCIMMGYRLRVVPRAWRREWPRTRFLPPGFHAAIFSWRFLYSLARERGTTRSLDGLKSLILVFFEYNEITALCYVNYASAAWDLEAVQETRFVNSNYTRERPLTIYTLAI